MRGEHFGKQMVIAIPMPLVVQRNQKEIGPLQDREDRVAFLLVSDGVTERTTQPVEDGGLKQEVTHRFGLALQDLFDQKVHDVPVVSSECLDESVNILMALQGQCG